MLSCGTRVVPQTNPHSELALAKAVGAAAKAREAGGAKLTTEMQTCPRPPVVRRAGIGVDSNRTERRRPSECPSFCGHHVDGGVRRRNTVPSGGTPGLRLSQALSKPACGREVSRLARCGGLVKQRKGASGVESDEVAEIG